MCSTSCPGNRGSTRALDRIAFFIGAIVNELAKVDWRGFEQQIEAATDLSEISKLYAAMEAVRVLSKERKMGLETINKAGAYMAKLAVKAAEIYEGLEAERGGDRKSDGYQTSTDLTIDSPKQEAEKELGKSREMIRQWGKLREKVVNEPEKIDAYYERATAKNQEGSLSGLYRDQTKKPYEFHYEQLPTGQYHVIYADPPWKISKSEWADKWGGAFDTISEKYSGIKTEDIMKLPVPELAAESSVLFLWTTHTFLHDAFHVAEAWGFKYNSLITWDKGSGWTTQKFHRSTELCLYCLRGQINYKGAAFPALIQEKRTIHSRKPDIMRALIEERIPEPRIELFAREDHPGWDTWGNQL